MYVVHKNKESEYAQTQHDILLFESYPDAKLYMKSLIEEIKSSDWYHDLLQEPHGESECVPDTDDDYWSAQFLQQFDMCEVYITSEPVTKRTDEFAVALVSWNDDDLSSILEDEGYDATSENIQKLHKLVTKPGPYTLEDCMIENGDFYIRRVIKYEMGTDKYDSVHADRD